ncbi:MAG: class I SAM-dependent methyltransferase, partial [Candidatus Promineifilaceae bacterium]|nr:class I SAM-dependent methyltransferase [Candidatus Promineifilaceae bacterium]
MAKKRVQDQFSPSAADYVSSAVHARGASLERIRALAAAGPGTRVLDVATGGGHTAKALATEGATVTGLDATAAMLAAARGQARMLTAAGLLSWVLADSQHLPFAAATFDLVVCRLAAHHFADISAFLAESRRVLVEGGRVIVADNFVPGSHRRGKSAEQQRQAGRFI